ncbi:ferritin-like domain-containing protein [Embleya sp. NPDC020886]|uniref:ferritin-like domain-containing protein n=1 Tax=Embleya sp. NPDC020886 TaxID=3363980 RepID=UPI00379694AD
MSPIADPPSTDHSRWLRDFRAAARARAAAGDPRWTNGARLHPALVRSIQRFQVGEGSDGRVLIAKAAADGDDVYTATIRLFVAEEQNHARLLAHLLAAAGEDTIPGHWSDAVFRRLRRSLGLRLELMVLMVAEVIALPYYGALRDGVDDPLAAEVAARILADEERHVPFHCDFLRASLADLARPTRAVAVAGWWVIAAGATAVVVHDHGPALTVLGTTRRRFAGQVAGHFRAVVRETRVDARIRPRPGADVPGPTATEGPAAASPIPGRPMAARGRVGR